MNKEERRYGKFTIPAVMLRLSHESVQRIYKEVIPTRVEFMYDADAFMVIGISELFDTLKEGEQIPEYEIRVDTFKNKKAELKITKVE